VREFPHGILSVEVFSDDTFKDAKKDGYDQVSSVIVRGGGKTALVHFEDTTVPADKDAGASYVANSHLAQKQEETEQNSTRLEQTLELDILAADLLRARQAFMDKYEVVSRLYSAPGSAPMSRDESEAMLPYYNKPMPEGLAQ